MPKSYSEKRICSAYQCTNDNFLWLSVKLINIACMKPFINSMIMRGVE